MKVVYRRSITMIEKMALPLLAVSCFVLSACQEVKAPEPKVLPAPEPTASAPPAYVLTDTEIRDITSRTLGRTYQVFVSLPPSYHEDLAHRYPVMFVTDANYAFPLVRNISRMVGDRGKGLEDFVLIGLSYAVGDTSQFSRRRDYIGGFETIKPSSSNQRYHRNNDMVRDLKTFEARLRSHRYPSLRIESTVIEFC